MTHTTAAALRSLPIGARRSRSHLLGGVCFSVGFLSLCASSPSCALAAEECGQPNSSGAVICTSVGNPYPNGINYSGYNGLSLTTDADVLSTGAIVLTGGGMTLLNNGTVSTTGVSGPGINLMSANGSIVVKSNDVSTTGAGASGIEAYVYGQGQVTVYSETVSSTGGGIGAGGYDAITINSGTVTTVNGTGITAVGGPITINSGSVETQGGSGIVGVGAGQTSGQLFITSGSILIHDVAVSSLPRGYDGVIDYPTAIDAYNLGGASTTVTSTGAITSLTPNSTGIYVLGQGPVLVTNAGSISVSALGIEAGTIAIPSTAPGALTSVVNTGDIFVSGQSDNPFSLISPPTIAGILVSGAGDVAVNDPGSITVHGSGGVGVYAVSYVPQASLSLQTGQITVLGDDGIGIDAEARSGGITISASGPIGVQGAADQAIRASAGQDISILTSAPLSVAGDGARGIVAISSSGAVDVVVGSVNVTGSSGGDSGMASAAVTLNAATNASFTVTEGSTISSPGDGVFLVSRTGSTVLNAGTIIGGVAAIETETGPVIVTNAGKIIGSVLFGLPNNTFNNNGSFISGSDSYFGGTSVLNNSGAVALSTSASPLSVSFRGLQTFNNTGLVDLRNGVAGDVLTLPGALNGQSGSALALDVRLGAGIQTADKLIVGSATGTTAVVLNNLGAGGGVLTSGISVVQVTAGASPSAFKLESGSMVQGFVTYGLAYDAADGTFDLVGTPDAAAYQTMKLEEGVQNLWHETAQAWSDHLTDLRDGRWSGDKTALSAGLHTWGQTFGSTQSRDSGQTVSVFGQTQSVDLSYEQTSIGLETGFDLVAPLRAGALVGGVSGGFTTSDLHFRTVGSGADYQVANIGLYGAYLLGPLFVNALVKYDHDVVSAFSATARYAQGLDGDSYGARVEAGYRWSHDRVYVEPLVEIGYVQTRLDGFSAEASQIDFRTTNSLRAQLGLRSGLTLVASDTVRLAPYVGAHAVQEFDGRDPVIFSNGGYSLDFASHRPGTSGEGAVGMDFASAAGLRGFIEGDGDFGGGYSGGGGRLGVRFAW